MSLRVVTFVGTRPEVIRLAAVLERLDRTVDHRLVHTGQNYDFELNELIFDDLGLRLPDLVLEPDTSTLGHMIGDILVGAERVLTELRPDAVLVLGDTNSCLAGLMAKRMHIPLFHMEAGNRCFDENVPEETNRRIIDHIADFNLVYTEHARRNLLAEGIEARRIYLTGSPLNEVLSKHRDAIDRSDVLDRLGLEPQGYIVVSSHREENVDHPDRLRQVVASIEALAEQFDVPIVLSAHPRTRKRLESSGTTLSGQILLHKPFGFLDYNQLQLRSLCAVSDSGTISEESAMLGFPAVTIRNSIERPEAMDTGGIVVTGIEPRAVVRGVRAATAQRSEGEVASTPADYQITNTSQRVVNLILGLSPLNALWSGVRTVEAAERVSE
jgi:UDP-N-acetylglucosamine 2-epimerase (non-hydrolysing)